MAKDEQTFIAFHRAAVNGVRNAAKKMADDPISSSLTREEVAVGIAMACLRMAALALVGGDIDPAKMDGYLEKYVEDLKTQWAARRLAKKH